jgi:hypothetical protein
MLDSTALRLSTSAPMMPIAESIVLAISVNASANNAATKTIWKKVSREVSVMSDNRVNREGLNRFLNVDLRGQVIRPDFGAHVNSAV